MPAIVAMSGAIAVTGQDAQKGIAVALEHINADGGVAGRPLKIQLYDTQGNPGVVRQVMERLTRLERAPVILGCEISAGTSAATTSAFWRSAASLRRFFAELWPTPPYSLTSH